MQNFETFKERSLTANVVPVVDVIPADLLTPLAVYLKLSEEAENSFLLESVEGGEALARYSFIGANPDFVLRGDNDSVTVSGKGEPRTLDVPLMSFLREHFSVVTLPADEQLPSFAGGAIGVFNFQCSSWFEPKLKRRPSGDDEASLMFFRSVVAFDHAKQIIVLISLVFTDEGSGEEADIRTMYERARAENARVRSVLESAAAVLPAAEISTEPRVTTSNWEQESFEKAVTEAKELISAGEVYQVVISQRFTRETQAPAVAIYRAIRSLNPSPYLFLIRIGDRYVIGASPEMLVRVRGREIEYRPIAGTRPRGKNIEDDARLAEEMQADPKEVAEHLMLVDLGRNDIGRVAEYGSVRVESLMKVEKYSHVQHLVSYLSARLRHDTDRFDAFASCFPAGTVSGAPKVSAIETISSLEPTPRGVYAGAVGYFDYAGNMDTCIAIRTMTLEDGLATVQAGAGIVADSVPESEYHETVNKARAMLRAIEMAESASDRSASPSSED